MSKLAHRIYVYTLVSIVIIVTIYLFYRGIPYYSTSLEERFYHDDHSLLKPSGLMGHGLGIIGTLMILFGVTSYIVRKRYKILSKLGRLKYWLEFHIFLCTLGPILILFHTAFKFGGIVAISFWSMVAVVVSGVIGRFIYIQIPRTIEGRELSLEEVKQMKADLGSILEMNYQLDSSLILQKMSGSSSLAIKNKGLNKWWKINQVNRTTFNEIKGFLKDNNLERSDRRKILKLVKNEMKLNSRISRLQTMQKLFKYWHVAHLPFALIMLIIMVIHVAITLAFGYTWVF